MKAHSDHAHATLKRIGGRAALRQRLHARLVVGRAHQELLGFGIFG
jgi:hypothetical protein